MSGRLRRRDDPLFKDEMGREKKDRPLIGGYKGLVGKMKRSNKSSHLNDKKCSEEESALHVRNHISEDAQELLKRIGLKGKGGPGLENLYELLRKKGKKPSKG